MIVSGAEVRAVRAGQGESAHAAISSCVDDETIAVVVSHVDPLTGYKHDLEALGEIAGHHGAALMVDLAQSAGVTELPAGLEGIDVAVGTTMKWLLGPPGLGYLYIRPGLSEHTAGLDVGYVGLVGGGRDGWPQSRMPDRVADSRKFELGLPNMAGLGAAVEGIKLLEQVEPLSIFEQVADLAGKCVRGLRDLGLVVRTPEDAAYRAGVVAFESDEAADLASYMRARGVDIGGLKWGLGRVDPHAFNDSDDVSLFLEGVRSFFELTPQQRREYRLVR
jgi:kynureninase